MLYYWILWLVVVGLPKICKGDDQYGRHPLIPGVEMPKRDPILLPASSVVPVAAIGGDTGDGAADYAPASGGGIPRGARAFLYHGVEFHNRSSKQWVGVCPFCDKPKFQVQIETAQACCMVCHWELQYKDDGITGNNYGFIKYLWRVSYDKTRPIDYGWLAAHRKLPVEGLREWGVCKSVTTGEWLVPGYGVKDPLNITQVYKYIRQRKLSKDGQPKYELFPTPGFAEGESHGILLPRSYSNDTPNLYICEGIWDAIALSSQSVDVQNRLRGTEGNGMEYRIKGEILSLSGIRGGIIAVPGCGIFKKDWTKYTLGKDITILFDNDHYKINEKTGLVQQPGFAGTKRSSGMIYNGDESTRAKSVSWLDWNLDGKGYDPDLEDGYDVRDWLMKDSKPIEKLLSYVRPVPDEWIKGGTVASNGKVIPNATVKPVQGERVKPIPCRLWKTLTDAFRLAAKWTPELNGALAVSLACICSVNGVGEPLWVRLISPPSTYKSQLCKALGTNERYCIMDDGMNGFYSGMDMGDGKDYSLVTKWFGKTLITKEGSTLFTNSRSEEIIGQARAIYDGEVDKRWNNGKHCSHRGWRGTWLLAGTPNMKDYDDNDLGPRFIDYTIVKDITDTLEDDIVMRAMMEQAGSGMASTGIDSVDSPDYLHARQLCGGYINYLRQDVDDGTVKLPDVPHDCLMRLATLAKYIERMRGRPSKNIGSESVDRALPARVGKQLVKLVRFVCVVMQRVSIDKEVMSVVYKVAMDTSSGWSQEIVSALTAASRDGDEGLEPKSVANRVGKELKEIAPLLSYLTKIDVLNLYTPTNMPSPVRQARYRLTDSFRGLYTQVRSMV